LETSYLTPREVAERLRLRVQTIYDYIRTGKLPAIRLGNRCRIAQSDLELFLARRQGDPASLERVGDGNCRAISTPEPQTQDRLVGEQIERNRAARQLLADWLADESGYDDRAWPVVTQLLEEHPVAIGDPDGA